jgi:hypothetical protein
LPRTRKKKTYEDTISEAQFQAMVIELARRRGFRLPDGGPKGTPLDLIYHDWDSRRSVPGFPDLCQCKPGKDGQPGRLIFAELKSEAGRVRPEQKCR